MSIQRPNVRVLIPGLLEREGPLTRAELAVRLGLHAQSSTLDDALKRLRAAGSVGHNPARHTWEYRAPYTGLTTLTLPNSISTPDRMEAVFRVCHGLSLQATIQKTGFDKHTVRRCLARLAAHGRIQYSAGAWRHITTHTRPELAITRADLDWQKYWHPDNRQQRRAEALRV